MPTAETDGAPLGGVAELDLSAGGGSADAVANIGLTELNLSEPEREMLDLYDRLQEMQLETSLLNAQGKIPSRPQSVTEKELEAEKEALLESKSQYSLKNAIVENVLVANPVLKSVHAGFKASPIERDLFPLIQERDKISVQLTETASKTLAARKALSNVEVEHILISRTNAELVTRMMGLAEEANAQTKDNIKDPNVKARLVELEQEIKVSRQRWRMMKGTASAAVAGSGMDWSRDRRLRDLVLDSDSEEE